MTENNKQYCCYILANNLNERTYVGITNDFHHRFRAHSGLISGGALYTKLLREEGRWHPVAQITGFPDKTSVLQFEYCMKQKMSKYRVKHLDLKLRKDIALLAKDCEKICKRVTVLLECLSLKQWSSNAKYSGEMPLKIVWYTDRYRPRSFSSSFLTDKTHLSEVIHAGIINDHTVRIYNDNIAEMTIISKPFL